MRYGKSVALGLGLTAAAMHGFGKGVNSMGASSEFFNSISGNPNLDQDMLGTNLSATGLLFPSPLNKLSQFRNGIPGARSGLPRLMSLLSTGFVNSKSLTAGFVNSRTYSPDGTSSTERFSNDVTSYTGNAPPQADGSMVFGMYNSRYGR